MKEHIRERLRDRVDRHTPLRLDVAAALAYPDGSMTSSGLRNESRKGRLVIERTAGRDYTTLAAIEKMRQLCRQMPRDHVYGSETPGETDRVKSHIEAYGSSSMETIKRAQGAAATIVSALKESSRCISTASTPSQRRKASVSPIGSPSQTS